jgi:REP element-mobilizing transposase RayT
VARGEFVFANQEDIDLFLETLCEIKERDGLLILAWCLMTNHYHLVLKTGSVPLWRTMARLQRTVARGHNRRRRYLGRLWQSRYRARLVDSNDYFGQVVAYVHLNPVAAGLVTDPADYALSGHREAIGQRRPRILDSGALVELFGEENPSLMRTAYLEWVRSVAEAKWLDMGLRELPWWTDASDAEEIVGPETRRHVETYDQRQLVEDRFPLDLSVIVDAICDLTGVRLADLRSRKRRSEIAEARWNLTAIAVGRYDHKVCDVAEVLSKNPGSVSRWLTEAGRRQASDPGYRTHLDHLERRVVDLAAQNITM